MTYTLMHDHRRNRTEYDTESTPDDSMKHVISLAETLLNWLINIYCEFLLVVLIGHDLFTGQSMLLHFKEDCQDLA